MKGLAKIIGIILGILGLSSKASSVKKAKVKKIDTKVKTIKKKFIIFFLLSLPNNKTN